VRVIVYDDGYRDNGRRPCLYLENKGIPRKFSGGNIPKNCVVTAKEHIICEKVISVIYQISLLDSVEAMHFIPLKHKDWGINFVSWAETAKFLGLTIDRTEFILRAEFEHTAERLDKLRQGQIVESGPNEMEIININFLKTIDNYLNIYKSVLNQGNKITLKPGKKPGPGPGQKQISNQNRTPNWLDPIVTEPEGSKVIFAGFKPSKNGIKYTILVAIPPLNQSL